MKRADPMPPALVLAAGLGTRLRPLTDRVPKCLVPIGGTPLLRYWHERFLRDGIPRALINVHAHAEQVRAFVAALTQEGPVHWSVFEEPELLGSAGTLRATLDRLEDGPDFLVIYADNVSAIDLAALVSFHRERRAEFTMALFEAPEPSACGIATLDGSGRITAFEEKPEHPLSDLANAGIYVISRGVVGSLLDDGSFDLAFEVLPKLAGRMHGFPIGGYHRDVGTPAGLREIEADVAAGVLERAREVSA